MSMTEKQRGEIAAYALAIIDGLCKSDPVDTFKVLIFVMTGHAARYKEGSAIIAMAID